MTPHGGIATSDDVKRRFDDADKIMVMADAIEAAAEKKAIGKRARAEDDSLGTPRAGKSSGKKKKVGSPRSAIKLSDGGPSRGHDVNGPGPRAMGSRPCVRASSRLPPAKVSPAVKVSNKGEWAVRTRVQMRRVRSREHD